MLEPVVTQLIDQVVARGTRRRAVTHHTHDTHAQHKTNRHCIRRASEKHTRARTQRRKPPTKVARDPHMSALLHDYFATLPKAALNRLYEDKWTCQGLLRALPALARLYALRLVMLSADEGSGVPAKIVSSWPMPEAQQEHDAALDNLRRLGLLLQGELSDGGGEAYWLHRGFAKQLRDCLCAIDELSAADERKAGDDGASSSSAAGALALAEIEQQANGAWERVLHAILQPTKDVPLSMECKGASVHALLKEAQLLEVAQDTQDDEMDGGGPRVRLTRLTRTYAASSYLLQPTHVQVWRLVRAYMELAERGTPGTRHSTLCFLMRLGLLQLGTGYRMDDLTLDAGQRATLADMALLGLVIRPRSAPNTFYATHLSQHLLTSGGATAAGPSSGGGGIGVGGRGFIVLETNFRLYAYTSSVLWAQVLQLFLEVRYVLPNMVVGDLTRDSVLAASYNGISSDDIANFLQRNADPRMLGLGSAQNGGAQTADNVMPENVITMMKIWSKEPHRVTYTNVVFYNGFPSLEEFQSTLKYAKDNKAVVWQRAADTASGCALAVEAAMHPNIKKFIRTTRAERAAAAIT